MKSYLYSIFLLALAGTTGILLTLGQKDVFLPASIDGPEVGDYICWANPSKEALEKCGDKCSGVGVYAWHKQERVARRTAISFCNKTYGRNACRLDYCERMKTKW